jgi:hypothetical protein
LEVLGIAEDEGAAQSWLALAGEDNAKGLAARAHRSALDAPRPVDNAFLDLFDEVERLS